MADTAITPPRAALVLKEEWCPRSPWLFVASSYGAPQANPSLTFPAGIQAGDLILVVVDAVGLAVTSTSPTLTTIYSWTTNYPYFYVYQKVADGTESGTTFTATGGSNSASCVCVVYRNSEKVPYVSSASNSSGSSTGVSSLSVTTPASTNAQGLCVGVGVFRDVSASAPKTENYAISESGNPRVARMVPRTAGSSNSGAIAIYDDVIFGVGVGAQVTKTMEATAPLSWTGNSGVLNVGEFLFLLADMPKAGQSLLSGASPLVSVAVGTTNITPSVGFCSLALGTPGSVLGTQVSSTSGAASAVGALAVLVLGTRPAISTAQSQITGLQGLVGITITPQPAGLGVSGALSANSFGTLRQPSAGTSLISGNLSPWGVGDQTSAGALFMAGNAPLISGQLVPSTASVAASGISSQIDRASYPGAAELQGIGSYVGSMDTLLPTLSAILSVSVSAPIPNYDELPGASAVLFQASPPSVSYGTSMTVLTGAVTAQGTQAQQSYSSVIPVGSLVAAPVAASVTRQDTQAPATGNLFAASGNNTIVLGVQSQAGTALLGVSSPDVTSQTIRVPGAGAVVSAGTALVTDSGIRDGTGAISAQGQAAGIKLTSSILLITGNSILVGSSPSAVVAPFLMSPATGSLTAAGNFPVRVYQPLGMSAVCAEAPVGRVSTSINH